MFPILPPDFDQNVHGFSHFALNRRWRRVFQRDRQYRQHRVLRLPLPFPRGRRRRRDRRRRTTPTTTTTAAGAFDVNNALCQARHRRRVHAHRRRPQVFLRDDRTRRLERRDHAPAFRLRRPLVLLVQHPKRIVQRKRRQSRRHFPISDFVALRRRLRRHSKRRPLRVSPNARNPIMRTETDDSRLVLKVYHE